MKKIAGVALCAASILASAACATQASPSHDVAVPSETKPGQPTQQQIWIDWLAMSLQNKECSLYEQPTTWQDLMLPPRRAKSDGSDGC